MGGAKSDGIRFSATRYILVEKRIPPLRCATVGMTTSLQVDGMGSRLPIEGTLLSSKNALPKNRSIQPGAPERSPSVESLYSARGIYGASGSIQGFFALLRMTAS
jgi:hypothetical protein